MSRIKGDRLGIVQRRKHHCLLQILEYLLGDSLMPVQQRPGVHYPVAHRVDRRHPGPAYRMLQQRHRIFIGCIVALGTPLGSAPGPRHRET